MEHILILQARWQDPTMNILGMQAPKLREDRQDWRQLVEQPNPTVWVDLTDNDIPNVTEW